MKAVLVAFVIGTLVFTGCSKEDERGTAEQSALPRDMETCMACDVLQHHLHGTRDGLYVDPLITQAAATSTRRDTTFSAPLPGPTYAQPLYVTGGPGGRAAFIVVTE